jgi:hypothetical protein
VDDAMLLLYQGRINSPRVTPNLTVSCVALTLCLPNGILALPPARKDVLLNPDNGEYHSCLGRIQERRTPPSFIIAARLAGKVRNEFEATVRLNPKSVDARADLADFYLEAPGIVGSERKGGRAGARDRQVLDPATQSHRVQARIAGRGGTQ